LVWYGYGETIIIWYDTTRGGGVLSFLLLPGLVNSSLGLFPPRQHPFQLLPDHRDPRGLIQNAVEVASPLLIHELGVGYGVVYR